ncbi:MFS transporter [Halomarina litorea]|uniref:MFS transporter n=1 Tax=Halomarina litorea TaxID=2961595 RepID=UPI0020C3EA66|nr:MFS transporter [Halomarina sp. BCD28]
MFRALRSRLCGLTAAARAARSDGRTGVLLTVATGWLLVLGVRLVLPALLPRISREFTISHTVSGSLFTLLLAVSAFMQFPSGLVADRISGRAVLLAGLLVAGAGVLLMTAAPLFAVFVLGVALFGLGTGLFGTPRVTVLSAAFPDNEGTAIGFSSAAGNVGTATLPVVATALAVSVGWRGGFAFVLPLFALTAVATWRVVPVGGEPSTDPVGRTLGLVARSLSRRSVLLASTLMLAMFFVYQGVTAFLPTYLVEEKALSEPLAATLFGLFFAGGVVSQLAVGRLGDRYGPRPALVGVVGTSALLLAVVPAVSGVGALAALSVGLSVQLGVWPVAFSYTVGELPDAVQTSGLGLLRSGYLVLGSLGSLFVGVLADAGRFDEAFLALSGVALLALLVCFLLPAPAGPAGGNG